MRLYDTSGIPEVMKFGSMTVVTPQVVAVIYGFSCRSPYPEDAPYEDERWEVAGEFMSVCFSVMEPNGEFGFTPIEEVTEISREEFEAARDHGWAR